MKWASLNVIVPTEIMQGLIEIVPNIANKDGMDSVMFVKFHN